MKPDLPVDPSHENFRTDQNRNCQLATLNAATLYQERIMKRFALPALILAAAVFGLSSTASAGHQHGGNYGQSYGNYSYGNQGYNSSFAPGGCYSRGYYPQTRNNYYPQSYQYNNYGYNSYGNGWNSYGNGHNHYHNNYNQGGLRLRSGGLSFGLRF